MSPAAITWQARIEPDGKVKWRDPQEVHRFVMQMAGKRVLVTIEEYHGRRTLNQNSYFHGPVCEAISEYTGWEPYEVKELMKAMFLYSVDRRGRVHLRSTAKLNRQQMSEFIERVICWAATWLGVVIPPPELCRESWQ